MPKEIARAATDVSDEETMSAIRAMMTESATLPKQVPCAAQKPQHAAPKPRVARPDVPEPSAPAPERLSQRKRLSSPRLDLLGRIRRIRYRPSRRLVFWCVLALLVFLKPHVFVIGALLTVFVIGNIIDGENMFNFR